MRGDVLNPGALIKYDHVWAPKQPWSLLSGEGWYCPKRGQVGMYTRDSFLGGYMVILFEDKLVCVDPEYLEAL